MSAIYDITAKSISGESVSLSTFKDSALVIVNVASECGLTPHYKGLQELFNNYKDKGLMVLGFPCNQFGAQEPGSEADIQSFCEKNFGVSFPMFAKIEVNGDGTHPLYKFLKSEKPGQDGEDIEWNFAKFLINKNGEVVKRFHPKVEPSEMAVDIEAVL